jgi:hypothetical protein
MLIASDSFRILAADLKFDFSAMQGDQIGRIFVFRETIFLRSFFEKLLELSGILFLHGKRCVLVLTIKMGSILLCKKQ